MSDERKPNPLIGIWILIAITVIMAGIIAVLAYQISPQISPQISTANDTGLCTPTDYTNGIYFFPCSDGLFGIELAKWKDEHQNLIITTISADDNDAYGYTSGYFVITEPKGEKNRVSS